MSTTAAVTTEQHKTFFGRLIAGIGAFFSGLLNSMKKAWNSLSTQQQQGIINGVNVSQIIKEGYKEGEAAIVAKVSSSTGLTTEQSETVLLTALKDSNINVTKVQDGLDALANKVEAGITDNAWNALWKDFAKFAALALSGGKLDWVSLSMGLVEFAFQHFIAAKKSA